MKKFKFNLETVLKIRKLAVDKEIKNLSLVAGSMNRIKNEITQNQRNIHLANQTYQGTDLKNLKLYETYFKGLTLQNEALQKTLSEKEKDLNQAREKLLVVEKDMKVIEIIKERKLKEFHERLIKLENLEEEEQSNKLHRRKIEEEENEESNRVSKPLPIHKKTKVREDPNKPKSEYERIMEFMEAAKKGR